MKKRIIITGCSRGLGLELARSSILNGHFVVGISRTPVSDPMINEHKEFKWISCDLASATSRELILNELDKTQNFDLVFHNAGVGFGEVSILQKYNSTFLKKAFELNFDAVIQFSQFLINKSLVKRHPIHQVFISTIATQIPIIGLAGYAATKSATESFFMHLARELRNDDCFFSIICPDYFESEMSKNIIHDSLGLTAQKIADEILKISCKKQKSGISQRTIISNRTKYKKFIQNSDWVSIID